MVPGRVGIPVENKRISEPQLPLRGARMPSAHHCSNVLWILLSGERGLELLSSCLNSEVNPELKLALINLHSLCVLQLL